MAKELNLAYGLHSLVDWTVEYPYLDLMKIARPWFKNDGTNGWSTLVSEGKLDANGWPTGFPAGWTSIFTRWFFNEDPNVGMANADLVVTWEGEGTISLGSVTVTSTGDHRIEFTNNGGGLVDLNITSTDPNTNGSYIKNVKVFRAEHEALILASEKFNPDFLRAIRGVKLLRFMDPMWANGSTQSEWADRPTPTTYSFYGTDYGRPTVGMPVEDMVELANLIGADAWFTLPHLSTDEYVTEFATYVRDNLGPSLKASIEFSNEIWNFAPGFSQTGWAASQAQAIWGTDPIALPIGTLTPGDMDYKIVRATQVAKICHDVYTAGAARSRLRNVFAIQIGAAWTLENRQLTPVFWNFSTSENAANPGDPPFPDSPLPLLDPKLYFDAVAETSYFGNTVLTDATNRSELLDYLATHTDEEGYDWLRDKLLDPEYPASIPSRKTDLWDPVHAVTTANDLEHILYEGGQHVHSGYSVGSTTPEQVARLSTFMMGFCYSEQMAELYDALWDLWESMGTGSPFMQFVVLAPQGANGSWGARRYLSDSNPRLDCLSSRALGLPYVPNKSGVFSL